MKKILLITAASIPLFASVTAVGGQATGTVNVVNINPAWNGAFVQLNIPVTQNYEPQCPNANWAFILVTDPFYASIVATLLTAKATGETVTVHTSGCVSGTYGSQPRITTVDYGTRMSGT